MFTSDGDFEFVLPMGVDPFGVLEALDLWSWNFSFKVGKGFGIFIPGLFITVGVFYSRCVMEIEDGKIASFDLSSLSSNTLMEWVSFLSGFGMWELQQFFVVFSRFVNEKTYVVKGMKGSLSSCCVFTVKGSSSVRLESFITWKSRYDCQVFDSLSKRIVSTNSFGDVGVLAGLPERAKKEIQHRDVGQVFDLMSQREASWLTSVMKGVEFFDFIPLIEVAMGFTSRCDGKLITNLIAFKGADGFTIKKDVTLAKDLQTHLYHYGITLIGAILDLDNNDGEVRIVLQRTERVLGIPLEEEMGLILMHLSGKFNGHVLRACMMWIRSVARGVCLSGMTGDSIKEIVFQVSILGAANSCNVLVCCVGYELATKWLCDLVCNGFLTIHRRNLRIGLWDCNIRTGNNYDGRTTVKRNLLIEIIAAIKGRSGVPPDVKEVGVRLKSDDQEMLSEIYDDDDYCCIDDDFQCGILLLLSGGSKEKCVGQHVFGNVDFGSPCELVFELILLSQYGEVIFSMSRKENKVDQSTAVSRNREQEGSSSGI